MSLVLKEVRKLKGYSLQRPSHRVKLNQNESPYDLPESLKQKILERLKNLSWNRYPTPFCDSLRQKLAEREGWNEKGVLVAGGSNILIQAIVIACAVRGRILTVVPGFSLYEIEGALLGNKIVSIPLSRDNFSLPADFFLKQLKKVRPQIVFLANPNAPTGNLFIQEDLFRILEVSRKTGSLVVVDEAYYPFSRFTLFSSLKKFPNLILLRTFSKAFSLGGVRLGYLLGDPKIVQEIIKVILPFSVGLLSQAIGEVVLENESYVEALVSEIIEEREKLYRSLQRIVGLKVYPSSANFILFRSPQSKLIFRSLLKEGILIRDISSKNLPQSLRVTVGSPTENQAFLDVMRQIALDTPLKIRI